MSKFYTDVIPEESRFNLYNIESVECISGNIPADMTAYEYLYELQKKYSSSFIYLYNSPFDIDNHKRLDLFKDRFFSEYTSISWLLASLWYDYKAFAKANDARRDDFKKELVDLKEDIKKLEERKQKHEKIYNNYKSQGKEKLKTARKSLKIIRKTKKKLEKRYMKAERLKDVLSRRVVFGGRDLLRYINKIENFKRLYWSDYEKLTEEEIQSLIVQDKDNRKLCARHRRALAFKQNPKLLEEKHEEYSLGRLRPVTISGEKLQTGNRMFNLAGLPDGYVDFKFNECVFRIKFSVRKYDCLDVVAALAATKRLAVSVRLDFRPDRKCVQFGYDVNEVSNYIIDMQSVKEQIAESGSKSTIAYKKIVEKNLTEISSIVLKDNRCLSIDLNPDNIGISVLEKTDREHYITLYTETIYYPELLKNLHVASSSDEAIHQRNKQKHEVIEISHYIFRILLHYRCSKFVCEKLDFKSSKKSFSKAANRKNRNKWMRGLYKQMFKRLCAQHKVSYREVLAQYSSFIGNIQHGYADSASAACEIGRRGLFCLTNKLDDAYIFPVMTEKDVATLKRLFPSGTVCEGLTENSRDWIGVYTHFKKLLGAIEINTRFRQGNVTEKSRSKSRLFAKMSMVTHNIFVCDRREIISNFYRGSLTIEEILGEICQV